MTEAESDAIVVFTARSPERIVEEGGSQAWVLNPANAKQRKWLVCTQNRHNPDHEFSDATEPHGSAFLVGKISDVVPSREPGSQGRWMIAISEFASINIPGVWNHWRNPFRYTTLEELGIDPDDLDFQAMPRTVKAGRPNGSSEPAGLTIAQAKSSLAATFGVSPDAIEITIRG
jgi:hypothetical protein